MGLFQLLDQANENQIEPPEVAKLSAAGPKPPPGQKGPPKGPQGVNWKQAAGSGPWMISNFVSGSSITFKKNPDYYLHDERHTQNQIPYIDTLKTLIISDTISKKNSFLWYREPLKKSTKIILTPLNA